MNKEENDINKVLSDDDIQRIKKLVETIKYGTLTLVFQDGRLIQIERNEKIRTN